MPNTFAARVAARYIRKEAGIQEDTGLSTPPISKPTLIRRLYKLINPLTKGFFSDDSWQPVHQFFKLLTQAGVFYTLTRTEYGKNDTGTPSSKTWWFTVPFLNPAGKEQTIHGYIVAAGAGSVVDPLGRYDLTVVLN